MSSDINFEAYREILNQVDETISKFKNNRIETEDIKQLSKPSSSSQILSEKEKNFDNNLSELQLENSNLKYENDYLKRHNELLEESLNKLKKQYENLKIESDSFEERLNNLNLLKEKNGIEEDERYNNYINEIEEQFEILKRDNCLLVERQKGIDDFLHSKKDLFTQLGIKINDDENQIIDISLFEDLINHLITINQKISKDLELYKNQNKELFERLENVMSTNKELTEKLEKSKMDYTDFYNEQNNKNYESNIYMLPNNSNINIINPEEQRSFIKEDNINNYSINPKPPTPQLRNKTKSYYFNSPTYPSKGIKIMKCEDNNSSYNTNSYKSNNIQINNNNNKPNGNNSYYNQRQNRSFSIDLEMNKNNNNNYYYNNSGKYKGRNTPIKSEALEGLRTRIQRLDEMLRQTSFSNMDNTIFYHKNT